MCIAYTVGEKPPPIEIVPTIQKAPSIDSTPSVDLPDKSPPPSASRPKVTINSIVWCHYVCYYFS